MLEYRRRARIGSFVRTRERANEPIRALALTTLQGGLAERVPFEDSLDAAVSARDASSGARILFFLIDGFALERERHGALLRPG
jgi:hypothetical protein